FRHWSAFHPLSGVAPLKRRRAVLRRQRHHRLPPSFGGGPIEASGHPEPRSSADRPSHPLSWEAPLKPPGRGAPNRAYPPPSARRRPAPPARSAAFPPLSGVAALTQPARSVSWRLPVGRPPSTLSRGWPHRCPPLSEPRPKPASLPPSFGGGPIEAASGPDSG